MTQRDSNSRFKATPNLLLRSRKNDHGWNWT
jgi:hypothetical protein